MRSGLGNPPQNGDSRIAQDVLDHDLLQARGVVIEVEMIRLLVVAESLQSVGVGEFPERPEIVRLEPVLQFVAYGHECHERQYNIGGKRESIVRGVYLQLHAAEPQRIADDGDRAESHRGAGQDGAQQQPEERIKNSRGNRDANRVVCKREK